MYFMNITVEDVSGWIHNHCNNNRVVDYLNDFRSNETLRAQLTGSRVIKASVEPGDNNVTTMRYRMWEGFSPSLLHCLVQGRKVKFNVFRTDKKAHEEK